MVWTKTTGLILLVLMTTFAASGSASAARRHAGFHRHHQAYASHASGRHAHYASRRGHAHRRFARSQGGDAAMNAYASTNQAGFGQSAGFSGSGVVSEARRWIGGNPTGRSSLWCARFMNFVLERTGHRTTGSDMARSFSSYGQRVSGPQVGAIAVMSRGGRGGHVGVVSGIDASGNPIIISGNHGHRVAESVYSRGRIYAYVMP